MSTLAEYGHWYASKFGLANFPIYLDKNPCTPHGFYDAETDPEKLKKLYGKYPKAAGIAIATGKRSGNVFVLDLDNHPDRGIDGIELSEEWQEDHGPFPETWTGVSGSGGRHLYFIGDGNVDSCQNDDVGVDVRGNNGYIVAPPSKHPSGGSYFWDLAPGEVELAEANDSVYGFMKAYKKESEKGTRFHIPAEKIGEGNRNYVIFHAACSMQGTGFPDEVIVKAIMELNQVYCVPPLPEKEVQRTIDSALKNGKGGRYGKWVKAAELQKQELVQSLKQYLKN